MPNTKTQKAIIKSIVFVIKKLTLEETKKLTWSIRWVKLEAKHLQIRVKRIAATKISTYWSTNTSRNLKKVKYDWKLICNFAALLVEQTNPISCATVGIGFKWRAFHISSTKKVRKQFDWMPLNFSSLIETLPAQLCSWNKSSDFSKPFNCKIFTGF